jgi:hypothetical protein
MPRTNRFSKKKAQEIRGKSVLVGLTYIDYRGKLLERKQFHGVAVRADKEKGIALKLHDGSEFTPPPDLRALESAPRGEYRLHSTGEVVADPDYLCTYTVTRPDA